MDDVFAERPALELAAVRSRGVLFIKYAVWAMVFAFVAVAINLYLAFLQRWLALLESVRQLLGLHRPTVGLDWWLCFGMGAALILPVVGGLLLYGWYHRIWVRRLQDVWQGSRLPSHSRVRVWKSGARDTKHRIDYLRAICASPEWREAKICDPGTSADSYKAASEVMLKVLERGVCQRSITLGLTVGMSHNRAVDFFTIAVAAFEVQLHVLTRLGKRPSLALWKQMLTRTASSLFINSYLNANESMALRIAIKKIGLGLEVASDLIDHGVSVANQHLDDHFEHHAGSDSSPDDTDWDDAEHLIPPHVWGVPIKPLVSVLRLAAGNFLSVGTFGLRQLGVFIDKAGDELFQGALAGGILYFHGMAIAADCLALDPAHRQSSGMVRTIEQCVAASSEVAGQVLREAARGLRKALRDKRRRAIKSATDKFLKEASDFAETAGEKLRDAGEQISDAAKATGSAVRVLAKSTAQVSTSIRDHTVAAGQKAAEFTSTISKSIAAKARNVNHTGRGDGSATNSPVPEGANGLDQVPKPS